MSNKDTCQGKDEKTVELLLQGWEELNSEKGREEVFQEEGKPIQRPSDMRTHFLSSENWFWRKDRKTNQDSIPYCWKPAWGTLPMAKVMRKEARHTQRRDWASGVPLDILEHLPPKPEPAYFIALCSQLWLYGVCPPPPSCSLWKRVNLQLQLIKFLGIIGVFKSKPSDGSLTCLTSLPGLLQLCIRLFTVSQPREARES